MDVVGETPVHHHGVRGTLQRHPGLIVLTLHIPQATEAGDIDLDLEPEAVSLQLQGQDLVRIPLPEPVEDEPLSCRFDVHQKKLLLDLATCAIPPGYTAPVYTEWRGLTLRLQSRAKLWADRLWPAACIPSERFAEGNYDGTSVLELGAGPGLPSLVLAQQGAGPVVMTDFPDPLMLSNLRWNTHRNLSSQQRRQVSVCGHLWGSDTEDLMKLSPGGLGFKVMVLSDLLYELEHTSLLQSCAACLHPEGTVWVSFQLHDPVVAHRYLEFFDIAQAPPWNLHVRQVDQIPALDPLSQDYALGPDAVSDEVHVYTMAFHPDFL
eukprot:TRINITY_DN17416_c0_g1_i2.p1 TRINITY_DN17416_c0_g1~~TRINITY_DN17416_c0_g1_i2.p1  ORF type:complete len:321 (-),score=76.09 TRINITY_DN17416_c0_g1_i2:181-1143(-)